MVIQKNLGSSGIIQLIDNVKKLVSLWKASYLNLDVFF